ncbi:MAG: efflux RND transporter periplasmic adaptor subunit [Planctomycetota bacterium]
MTRQSLIRFRQKITPCLVGLVSMALLLSGLYESDASADSSPPKLDRYEGFTEPSRELIVESYLDGVLETLHVRSGDSFKKGDPLISLDNTMQALSVEFARMQSISKAEIKIAEARVSEAEVELESQELLAKNGSATERDVRRARAGLDIAMAELELARENIALAAKQYEIEQERLDLYTIRAPFDGSVLSLAKQEGAEEGAALQQNDQIMHIAELDPMLAKISLPWTVVRQLEAEQAYSLVLGEGGRTEQAKLKRIASQADRGSQLIEVVFEISNSDSRIRSGQRFRLLDTAPAKQGTAK